MLVLMAEGGSISGRTLAHGGRDKSLYLRAFGLPHHGVDKVGEMRGERHHLLFCGVYLNKFQGFLSAGCFVVVVGSEVAEGVSGEDFGCGVGEAQYGSLGEMLAVG